MNFAALQEGTQRLGAQLAGVTLVLMCVGLIYCAAQAYQERGVSRLSGHLVPNGGGGHCAKRFCNVDG